MSVPLLHRKMLLQACHFLRFAIAGRRLYSDFPSRSPTILPESFANKRSASECIDDFTNGDSVPRTYHQCSACTPYVRPLVRLPNGTPPTRPRKPFDQLAYVTNALNTGRPKNFLSAPICGANVHLRNQPS